MQTLQGPEVLEKPFCADGDKNTIPTAATGSQLASLAEGFPPITQQPIEEGGIPPEREDFNGALNLMSQFYFAFQNGWLPTFEQDVSDAIGGYAEGAVLWYAPTTGPYANQIVSLRSVVSNNNYNFNTNPGYIGTYWLVSEATSRLPPHVFTADNLVAGNDLEINQIIDPNVLNEDTLACFHFDGDTTNAVSTGVTLSDDFKSHITGYTDPLVNPWYPGRSAAIWASPNTTAWCKLFSEDFDTFGTLEDYTLEFILAATGANCWFEIKAIENATDGPTYPGITASYGGWEHKYYVRCGADSSAISNSPSFPFGTYSHIAIVRKNQVASIYVNGNLISQAANSLNFKNFAVRMEYETSPAAYLAEMVFSKIAKWDGNFTPPTAPYHQQEGGNQYEIKSTVIEKHATNCLTEVPQHINLELSSGTLTLKAGSKAYKASGAEIAVSSDITAGYGLAVDGLFMVVNAAGTSVHLIQPENVSSGSTQPTVGDDKRYLWYDTTNNVVNMYAPNSSTAEEVSWPVAVVSSSGSNTFSSIDNVFNTFGYIGGTVFVLPGVKGYIPNGYNEDGTLNNTPFETTAVLKINAGYNNHAEVYSITKNAMVVSQYYASQNDKPTTTGTLWYKPVENKMYRVQNDSSVVASDSCLVVRTVRDSSGNITTFNPVGVLRLSENSGASSGLGGNDMPSRSYIDLTLGASGSSYTAPADGYVVFASNTTGTQFLCLGTMKDDTLGLQNDLANTLVEDRQTGNSTYVLTTSIQVNAGQKFYASYNVPTNKVYYFRFIYTNSSAPVN